MVNTQGQIEDPVGNLLVEMSCFISIGCCHWKKEKQEVVGGESWIVKLCLLPLIIWGWL